MRQGNRVDPVEGFMVELPEFSDMLASLVEATGIAPWRLSVMCGLAAGTVPYLLEGVYDPLPETVDKIAMGLDLPPRKWDRLRAAAGYLPYKSLHILPISRNAEIYLEHADDKRLSPELQRRIHDAEELIAELAGEIDTELRQLGERP